jgi:hypothetical protein
LEGFVVSGSACILVADRPQGRRDPRGELGLFGVLPWGGKDQFDPRKRGTPNQGVRNEANPPRTTGVDGEVGGEADAGTGCTNKANFPAQPETNESRREQEGPPTAANCAKQSQLPPSLLEDKCFVRKELWIIGKAQSLGETKPIPAGTVVDKAGKGADAAGGTNRAKQTQFPTGRPGWANADTGRPKRAKRSQFPPGQQWAGPARLPTPPVGPIVRNEANLPRPAERAPAARAGKVVAAGGRRAKQSQFPGLGRHGGGGIRHHLAAASGACAGVRA